jgi:mono/diheme cytochrome c family protein
VSCKLIEFNGVVRNWGVYICLLAAIGFAPVWQPGRWKPAVSRVNSASLQFAPSGKGRSSAAEFLPSEVQATNAAVASNGDAVAGRKVFYRNCAHCHGDDARGEEGPDLYNLRKSHERIATIIKGGIKGEMPAFREKLTDADVQSLIAYLGTLKD